LLDLFLRWQFQDYPFSVNNAFEDILFQQVPADTPTTSLYKLSLWKEV